MVRIISLIFFLCISQRVFAQPYFDSFIIKYKNQKNVSTQALSYKTKSIHRSLKFEKKIFSGMVVAKIQGLYTMAGQKDLMAELQDDPNIEFIEPDYYMQPFAVTPNDPLFTSQWHYFDERSGINVQNAWSLTKGSSDLVVAVIDTGYLPHADLVDRLVSGYDFINNLDTAGDGDGWDSDPTDPGDGNSSECPANSSWHGLHVAGTIGASTDNDLGVSGVNWYSKIMPVRTLGNCGGPTSGILESMRWAAGLTVVGAPTNPNPAKVLNLSLGTTASCSTATQTAIDEVIAAGSTIVVAAGNDSVDLASTEVSPAVCNNVITVAAVENIGGLASYSNYGTAVKIAAPGGDTSAGSVFGVLSLLNSGTSIASSDSYEYYQGTSMATPHVAGVVSLMLSINSKLTPAQILTHI